MEERSSHIVFEIESPIRDFTTVFSQNVGDVGEGSNLVAELSGEVEYLDGEDDFKRICWGNCVGQRS